MWMLFSLAAHASDLQDATGLYASGSAICARLSGRSDHCWQAHEPARPRQESPDAEGCHPAESPGILCNGTFHPLPDAVVSLSQVRADSWCAALPSGEVHCVGRTWRIHWGMPPGTPTDRPVRVPDLDDVIELGGPCALRRDGSLLCGTEDGLRALDGVPPLARLLPPLCGQTPTGEVACWVEGRARVRLPEVLDASLPLADGRRGALRALDGQVWYWNDGPRSLRELPVPPVRAERDSLVLTADQLCVLAPGGRVACLGDGAERRVDDGTGPPLWWEEAGAARMPQCSIVSGRVHCSDGLLPPTRALPVMTAQSLVETEAAVCALDGQVVRCTGEQDGWLLEPARTRLEGVLGLAAGERIGAIGTEGLSELVDGRWALLLPGSFDRIGARAGLLCAREDGVWLCPRDGGTSRVGAELDVDLCGRSGCLSEQVQQDMDRARLVEVAP